MTSAGFGVVFSRMTECFSLPWTISVYVNCLGISMQTILFNLSLDDKLYSHSFQQGMTRVKVKEKSERSIIRSEALVVQSNS
jgi:hypothetical protein